MYKLEDFEERRRKLQKTNEMYTISASDPLIRGGLNVSTKVSGDYLVPTMCKFMDRIREFNKLQSERKEPAPPAPTAPPTQP